MRLGWADAGAATPRLVGGAEDEGSNQQGGDEDRAHAGESREVQEAALHRCSSDVGVRGGRPGARASLLERPARRGGSAEGPSAAGPSDPSGAGPGDRVLAMIETTSVPGNRFATAAGASSTVSTAGGSARASSSAAGSASISCVSRPRTARARPSTTWSAPTTIASSRSRSRGGDTRRCRRDRPGVDRLLGRRAVRG